MRTHYPMILFIAVAIILFSCNTNSAQQAINKENIILPSAKHNIDSIQYQNLINRSEEAFTFCTKKKYNTDYCLLINMQKHSGTFRFYVWDFNAKHAVDSGLVSHGCCDKLWSNDESKEKVQFSNVPESHCSSLGKYRVGKRGVSNWGIKVNYLIHGLEATNNNAVERSVVLHSWEAITDAEIYPKGSAESWGCPAVSNAFMQRLDERLQKSNKSVLLWIFN
ncbi:MAG: murein L,D-transpeptidase catalytic domain family protein [Fimbriimonadaceae bacterium]|nr:murein L,D-transpeptidase catalytic domain family protein [Chitinophagales bacterium]